MSQGLRRSTSESKVEKDRRNEERALKSRSVHFHGSNGISMNGNNQDQEFNLEPISIIGRKNGIERNNGTLKEIHNFDLPPPPEQRKKPIIAQRPNSFMSSFKVSFLDCYFISNVYVDFTITTNCIT